VIIKPVVEKDEDNKNNDNDEDEDEQDDENNKNTEVDQDVKDDQNTEDGGTVKNSQEPTVPGNNTGTDTVTETKDQDGRVPSPSGMAVTERTGGSIGN